MEEIRDDIRTRTAEEVELNRLQEELIFKLNHTMPHTDEYSKLINYLKEELEKGHF